LSGSINGEPGGEHTRLLAATPVRLRPHPQVLHALLRELGGNNGYGAGRLSIGSADMASEKCLPLPGDTIIPNNSTIPATLTSGACTMPRRSQACLLGYTPSPQQALQGDAAHQAQRRTWLTPKDSPGPWYTRRDDRSIWTLHPFHRPVFTAHTWRALPARQLSWL